MSENENENIVDKAEEAAQDIKTDVAEVAEVAETVEASVAPAAPETPSNPAPVEAPVVAPVIQPQAPVQQVAAPVAPVVPVAAPVVDEKAAKKAAAEAKKAEKAKEKAAKKEAKKAEKKAKLQAKIDACPRDYKPLSTSKTFWTMLFCGIPALGLIISIFMSLIPINKNIKFIAKGLLFLHIIGIILLLIALLVAVYALGADLDSIIDAFATFFEELASAVNL